MFEGLFDEEASQYDTSKGGGGHSVGIPRPPPPRNSTGLCGLSNLGATCYLNSLLQTLHYTPEFREALFSLGEDELGIFSDREGHDNSMVRAIPVQLQRLFLHLLLLNQQSADVDALTTSFGWKNNEEFQQHDVQELNRILFSAIESSLLGTTGERLIAKLYHGTTVQQITCQRCGRVSEREEEFLDLPVALTGRTGLTEALKEAYIEQETLDGVNQYCCERCDQLVDAKRGCHIRKLPSILTFALLRFLYDFKKGERYKDTTKFKFPLEVDMSPYCEPESVKGGSVYELYSVVIHSGSTHSGHYTAYIRDVDDLGVWTHPDNDSVQLQADPTSGNVDLIEYDNPADLIKALLKQIGRVASMSKLSKVLQEKTGVTWNKRFKKQFGPFNQFLKSCSDIFTINDTNQVQLKEPTDLSSHSTTPHSSFTHPDRTTTTPDNTSTAAGESSFTGQTGFHSTNTSLEDFGGEKMSPLHSEGDHEGATLQRMSVEPSTQEMLTEAPHDRGSSEAMSTDDPQLDSHDLSELPTELSCNNDVAVAGEREKKRGSVDRRKTQVKKERDLPPSGHRWFEFNDTHVSPISVQSIDKMFQGKQSAYMLFYRRKSLLRPQEARGNPVYAVPERLQVEAVKANTKLDDDRVQYDVAINTVSLNIHISSQFVFANGALQKLPSSVPTVVRIDRRKPLSELHETILEVLPDEDVDDIAVHTAKSLPAGMHLYDPVLASDSTPIVNAGITDESHLFVWDGEQVGGEAIQVGTSCEPVLLHLTYPSPGDGGVKGEEGGCELVSGFAKNSTLGELRSVLSGLLGVESGHVTISQVKVSERGGQSSVVVLTFSKDKISLEDLHLSDGDRLAAERGIKRGVKTLAHSVADKQNKMLSLIVEDRCSPLPSSSSTYPVHPIEIAKDEMVSTLKDMVLSRLSVVEIPGGGRLRVDDDNTGLGPPLYENQTLADSGMRQGYRVILEQGIAPLDSQVVLQCMVCPGSSTSSSSELFEVVLEKKLTVGECCRAMVMVAGLTGEEWHLRKTNWCGEASDLLDDETSTLEQEKLKSGDLVLIEEGRLPPKGFIQLVIFLHYPSSLDGTSSIDKFLENNSDSEEVPLHLQSPSQYYPPVLGELVEVGRLEISRESTLEDLKWMILTLPTMSDACVPTPGFLRVRELDDGRPGKILKLHNHSIKRHKLSSNSKLCCTVLSNEEELPTTTVVFDVRVRLPGERRYGPPTEVIYDTAKSTSPHGLRSHISDLLGIEMERLRIAKHKLETFDWIRIQDSYKSDSKRGRKRGRGGGSSKVNIKNSPILLRDGDTVGVKDLQYDPEDSDDFSTPEDDKGKAILAAIQEEKRKRRRAKGEADVFSHGGPSEKRQRRPEVGIKIFVPDYQSNSSKLRLKQNPS